MAPTQGIVRPMQRLGRSPASRREQAQRHDEQTEGFRVAARSQTNRSAPAPRPRKRVRRGGGGGRADSYKASSMIILSCAIIHWRIWSAGLPRTRSTRPHSAANPISDAEGGSCSKHNTNPRGRRQRATPPAIASNARRAGRGRGKRAER